MYNTTCRVTLIATLCCLLAPVHAQSSRSKPATSSRPGSQPVASAGPADFVAFKLDPPKTWKIKLAPVAAGFRKAVYTLPRVEGDNADGELIVFLFKGGAGSVEANLARWRSQMRKPEGLSEDEFCIFSKQKVDGMSVTIAEIRGSYAGDPRNPDKVVAGQMMLSAIIETTAGNYFLRTLGPEKTMQAHKAAWYKMLLSIKAGKK